ncbi:CO dehydrogenase nickel-insertion accessory protein CooC1 [Eubacterium ruminantium]|nr:CO dehydrogenase nickel-insertion accessory protein CooC1 [Eubacterium ruminantium]
MNSILFNGSITELAAGKDFVFILNREELLSGNEYNVIAESDNDIFLKCMYGSYNGQNSLYYVTEGFAPVSERITALNDEEFIRLFRLFLGHILTIRNCSLLDEKHIIVSLNKIFINEVDGSIRVTYAPMQTEGSADKDFEKDLRDTFAGVMRSIPNIRSERTEGLAINLQNSAMTLKMIYSMLGGNTVEAEEKGRVLCQNASAANEATEQNTGADAGQNIAPGSDSAFAVNPQNTGVDAGQNIAPEMSEKARRISNEQGHTGYLAGTLMPRIKLENLNGDIPDIVVRKDNFVIGRSLDTCDYAILETAVSRVHCKVSQVGNKVAVIDLGSANGTFVNGVRLKNGEARFIADYDVIKIGQSDFLVRFPSDFMAGEAAAKEKLKKAVIENGGTNINNKNIDSDAGASVQAAKPAGGYKTKLIMVHSATGGAGKTTVALGVSRVLSRNGKKVLYICTSGYQSFGTLMKERARTDASNISGCMNAGDLEKYIVHSDFDYIPEIKINGISPKCCIPESKYIGLIDSILRTEKYDAVIVDTESTISELNRHLIEESDQLLVVTRQGRQEYSATTGFVSLISTIALSKCIFICNNYDKFEYDAATREGEFDNIEISGFVEHFRNYDALSCNDFSRCEEIIKVAGRVLI